MKKKERKDIGEQVDCDLTPMIDMTFQLIAFFMILVNFSKAEQNNRIKLPMSALAKPQSEEVKNYITIHIDRATLKKSSGKVIPSKAYFGGSEYEFVDKNSRELKQALQNKVNSYPDSVDRSEVVVIIRADGDTETGKVQELIEMCKDSKIGYRRFALRAEKPK